MLKDFVYQLMGGLRSGTYEVGSHIVDLWQKARLYVSATPATRKAIRTASSLPKKRQITRYRQEEAIAAHKTAAHGLTAWRRRQINTVRYGAPH